MLFFDSAGCVHSDRSAASTSKLGLSRTGEDYEALPLSVSSLAGLGQGTRSSRYDREGGEEVSTGSTGKLPRGVVGNEPEKIKIISPTKLRVKSIEDEMLHGSMDLGIHLFIYNIDIVHINSLYVY